MSTQEGTVNVRVTRQTHQHLTTLAHEGGVSMQTVLDRAVEVYRRRAFLEGLNGDFATMRANPEAWAEETEERELWERTLADGLGQE